MHPHLKVSLGQHSDKGRKAVNQDFHGAMVPGEPMLSAKGVAVALADGIGSSRVSQEASESAVRGFLDDYYCTSEAWSVKRSGQRVVAAINSWLHAQNHHSAYRHDRDRDYVCTFSALVIKSTTAHIFHVGDSRIYRVHDNALEQLTEDHRVRVSDEQTYLGRALGAQAQLEIDHASFPVEVGEMYLLVTDGVYEHAIAQQVRQALQAGGEDLTLAAQTLVSLALAAGSTDNLTVQFVRIDQLPTPDASEIRREGAQLPLPPLLQPRMAFDGYLIVRELHVSHRSHIHLAVDTDTQERVVLKTPSVDMRADPAQLERFLMEEWVARRIDSPYVLKARTPQRQRHFLYGVMEYVEGQTLHQWMIDHPQPKLEAVRDIVEQAARGLQAFHRLEMLHQDLRPHNLMIDHTGTVKLIDFGSARVAGIAEARPLGMVEPILGTLQYTAPEYFLEEPVSPRSDLFSLGVIAYEMLTGRLPYGAELARTRHRAQLRKLRYASARDVQHPVPAWVDAVLQKAVHLEPARRHGDVAELAHDLRHPSQEFLSRQRPALIERHPTRFWQGLAAFLVLVVLVLLATHPGIGKPASVAIPVAKQPTQH